MFQELYLIYFNIILSEGNQYVTLRLKDSKTNINYIEILIMLAIINSLYYSVIALYYLFTHNFQSSSLLSFAFNNISFIRYYIIKYLCQKLKATHISSLSYGDHSFKKDIAQHIFDNGILNGNIQKLD